MTESSKVRTSARGGLRGLIETARWRREQGESLVLAIVLATAGSTYQKPGALVLLDARGVCHGTLSGGCLEADLEMRARETLERGHALLAEFNTQTDEDLVFGSGLGCRGQLWTLLMPLRADMDAVILDAMIFSSDAGLPLELSVSQNATKPGAGVAHVADRAWRWNHHGCSESGNDALIDPVVLTISPPRRILLIGAGPETSSLLRLGHELGWYVWALERRERWAALARAAGIDRLFVQTLAAVRAEIATARIDAVVIMNHHFGHDLEALQFCATTTFAYIGLLGPPSRRDELLHALGRDSDSLRSRLHAPVGLRLGGHGPEPIALSIAAELQQHFAQRDEQAT